MKTELRTLIAGAALLFTLAAPAEITPTGNVVEPVPDRKATAQGEPTGNMLKASDLIGMAVERGNRERVCTVEDIVIGLENGRIAAVIVALNANGALRAVPPGVLHYDLLQQTIHLKVDPERLKASPAVERPTWKETLEPRKLAALYRHFDAAPFFTVPGESANNTGTPLGFVDMATRLDGAPVNNAKNERIGEVHNCMVDLSTGRVPLVLVAAGNYTGRQGTLTPVPAPVLEYDRKNGALVLDTNKDALAKLPNFKAGEWPDINKGTYMAGVYHAYGLKPEKAAAPAVGADRAAGNAEKNTARRPLVEQGKSKPDLELTAAIRSEVDDRKDLSPMGRNVQIITKDGKVTLRGSVPSDEERNVIGQIAVKYTGRDRVDNRLEVR